MNMQAPASNDNLYSMSIKDVVEYFHQEGFSLPPRTASSWCEDQNPDTRILDCKKFEFSKGRKYFATRESVDARLSEYKRQAANTSNSKQLHAAASSSEQPQATASSAEVEELKAENKRLSDENLGLKVSNEAKDQFMGLMKEERGQLLKAVEDKSHLIGVLETKLEALPAPSQDPPTPEAH